MLKTILKNNLLRHVLFRSLLLGAVWVTSPSYAQIIIDDMAPASAYEAGILDDSQGALASDLWQGISAKRAAKLLQGIRPDAQGFAREMQKRALYSGGVPPQSANTKEYELWLSERLHGVLKLGDVQAFDKLLAKTSISPDNPSFAKLFVRRALIAGETEKACVIGDKNTAARSENYWVKLRAFCHAIRGEMSAAETTSDILARSDYKDKTFFMLLNSLGGIDIDLDKIKPNTALKIAMMREVIKKQGLKSLPKNLPPILAANIALDSEAPPDFRLNALFKSANILTAEQIRNIMSGLADGEAEKIDLAKQGDKKWDYKIWAQAWREINDIGVYEPNTDLIMAMLKQADRQGVFMPFVQAMQNQLAFIQLDEQVKNPEIFARIYVNKRDLAGLRALYLALKEDDKWRGRIALASDALGGGFNFGGLGVDIETRLKDKKSRARAVRDVYLAVALGAKLSSQAEDILLKTSLKAHSANPGALLALAQAAESRAKAETLLRAALIFQNTPPDNMRADDLARMIKALISIGQNDLAAQIAAQDFIRDN